MKQILLSMSALLVMSVNAQITDCSELFISEYVEGSGNNKALEIYNPTSSAIDLGEYIVIRYSNGSNSATPVYAIQLVGMIPANDVHVGVLDKRNPAGLANELPVADSLQAKADAFYSPDYNANKTWYWNGNDAIVLAKGSVNDILNSVKVDVFGKIGEGAISSDGGWTNVASAGFISNGYYWTEDHTLMRKSTVLSGDIDALDPFNVGLEWDSLAEDSWNNLGAHTCDCIGVSAINETKEISYVMYPNPAKIGSSVIVNSTEKIKTIELLDILGAKVFSTFSNTISTSDLAKGTYIVNVQFKDGRKVDSKLIIE